MCERGREFVCVRESVCVCQRERGREKERCVRVCLRERECVFEGVRVGVCL